MSVTVGGQFVSSTAELVDFYSERVSSFGFTSEAMFYRDRTQHDAKLKAHAEIVRTWPDSDTILDIGCGYGQLLRFVSPPSGYLGVDASSEFVEEARRRFPGEKFLLADAMEADLPKSSWVLLVGVLSSVPQPHALLGRACQLATKGVLFDITLAGRLPSTYRDLNRFSPSEVSGFLNTLGYAVSTIDIGARSWGLFTATRINKPF